MRRPARAPEAAHGYPRLGAMIRHLAAAALLLPSLAQADASPPPTPPPHRPSPSPPAPHPPPLLGGKVRPPSPPPARPDPDLGGEPPRAARPDGPRLLELHLHGPGEPCITDGGWRLS